MSDDNTTNPEWLIIILVYNHKYLDQLNGPTAGFIPMECQKNHLFNAFEDIKYNNNYKVVLVENRLEFFEENKQIKVREVINIVNKDPSRLDTVARHIPSDGDMTSSAKLSKLLKDIKSKVTAKKHALITFGHGSIFGINLISSPNYSLQPVYNRLVDLSFCNQQPKSKDQPTPTKVNILDKIDVNQYFVNNAATPEHFFNNDGSLKKELIGSREKILEEIDKDIILSNRDIAETIKDVYGKLDLLVMFNCLMQSVFTQFELKDCVDYFVAPVSGISHPGFNYRGIFEALKAAQPPVGTQDLAMLFLSTIKDEKDKYYKKFQKDIDGTWKIVCKKLVPEQYVAIKKSFSDLMNEILLLKQQGTRVFACLDQTLGQCFNYATYCLPSNEAQIDLLVFTTYLIEKINKGFSKFVNLKTAAVSLQQSLQAVQSSSFVGVSFFNSTDSFIDKKYFNLLNYGFGLTLQNSKYPPLSLQNQVYSQNPNLANCFPDFLNDGGSQPFLKFYDAFCDMNRV
ncbi:clostripain-related cysteine peptidase [Danxiaibacter flavus]|uniref:Clostripain-related cysteine peptidase n=1 Tax=Danxiaibacter flavus TaxID=3049108 RepID=A0ABV3ZJM3_9BACT|nr:clostripain-related cysteine peptidase [Chitinophagaceae bacterium DXS]